ncbi:unnamed protein product [Rangifer tarandus platyrhynchus]|uniref:Uncharacterized protein n=1 Tax=Rangifer tarandus platyrhynchus TaxID=3082113 RepID=A0AC60A7N8_RANTA
MRIQEASVASSKHNMIVTVSPSLWRLKGQEAMEPIWDPLRNSSARPLLSQLRLSCNQTCRNLNPPLPLAKNLLKATSISRQGVFIPSLRKSGQLDLESMKKKKEYIFSISKQPSGIFISQQGDSKLAGLSKLQISMFPALAKGKFPG